MWGALAEHSGALYSLLSEREGRCGVIDREQAERIAAEMTGASSDDPERGWKLEEFDAGWFVTEYAMRDRRGAAGRVIERESGCVMRFPSFVSPSRIIADYDAVLEHGRRDERWLPS